MARRRRVIFHIDLNSAFLSWTAVQLMQSEHQDIRLDPSVVSGNTAKFNEVINMSFPDDEDKEMYKQSIASRLARV